MTNRHNTTDIRSPHQKVMDVLLDARKAGIDHEGAISLVEQVYALPPEPPIFSVVQWKGSVWVRGVTGWTQGPNGDYLRSWRQMHQVPEQVPVRLVPETEVAAERAAKDKVQGILDRALDENRSLTAQVGTLQHRVESAMDSTRSLVAEANTLRQKAESMTALKDKYRQDWIDARKVARALYQRLSDYMDDAERGSLLTDRESWVRLPDRSS